MLTADDGWGSQLELVVGELQKQEAVVALAGKKLLAKFRSLNVSHHGDVSVARYYLGI